MVHSARCCWIRPRKLLVAVKLEEASSSSIVAVAFRPAEMEQSLSTAPEPLAATTTEAESGPFASKDKAK